MSFRALDADATLGLRRVLAVMVRMNLRPGKSKATAAKVAKRTGRFATASQVNAVASANPTLIGTSGGLQLTAAGLAAARTRPNPRHAIH